MAERKGVFGRLRDRLFGSDIPKKPESPPPESVDKTVKKGIPARAKSKPPARKKKEPKQRPAYFFQIGLDFGTSYSKCVFRDVLLDKCWIYEPRRNKGQELPFLIPSMVTFRGGMVSVPDYQAGHYSAEGLPHIKMALRGLAKGDTTNCDLRRISEAAGTNDVRQLRTFVEYLVIYYLAGCVGGARAEILSRYPDLGKNPDDFVAINCAVPVADAEDTEIDRCFARVLRRAWVLSERLAEHPEIEFKELAELIVAAEDSAECGSIGDICYVYPETSANVQGFIRSQSSRTGLYLFTDVGAGTVDQSVFFFSRTNNEEKLTYLHSNVAPLGSSQIELRAATSLRQSDWKSLERLRQEKENNSRIRPLETARDEIARILSRFTCRNLATSKEKLHVRSQLEKIRLLNGGGGDCENPYRRGARDPFNSPLFRDDLTPDEIGLPHPRDLELSPNQLRWLPRLSVAYGLSFQRVDLASFKFPGQTVKVPRSKAWRSEAMESRRVIRGGLVESD